MTFSLEPGDDGIAHFRPAMRDAAHLERLDKNNEFYQRLTAEQVHEMRELSDSIDRAVSIVALSRLDGGEAKEKRMALMMEAAEQGEIYHPHEQINVVSLLGGTKKGGIAKQKWVSYRLGAELAGGADHSIKGILEDASPPEPVDVMVISDLLADFNKPETVLSRLRFLREDGLVVMGESGDARTMDKGRAIDTWRGRVEQPPARVIQFPDSNQQDHKKSA